MAQRIYLGIVGGIFIVSGLFAFIDPHAMGEWLGIVAIDVTGETEIRATYGGLDLGTRASSPRQDRRRPRCNRLRNRPISNSIQSY